MGWENRSDVAYHLTIAEGDSLVAYAEVEPCVTGNVTVSANIPFSVGLGSYLGTGDVSEPAPTIIESSALGDRDEYRVMVTIAPDGSVSVEDLTGTVQPIDHEDC